MHACLLPSLLEERNSPAVLSLFWKSYLGWRLVDCICRFVSVDVVSMKFLKTLEWGDGFCRWEDPTIDVTAVFLW